MTICFYSVSLLLLFCVVSRRCCHSFQSSVTALTKRKKLSKLKISTDEVAAAAATDASDATTINGIEDEINNDGSGIIAFDEMLLKLPKHSNSKVNELLRSTQESLIKLHEESEMMNNDDVNSSSMKDDGEENNNRAQDIVFSNSYVDLGKVDIVGFDYDYTLLTYREELLDLIYEMARHRLVMDRKYPLGMLDSNKKFDPKFSIRGLAVDKETGWVCHLSYTHKVAVAWEGREKVSSQKLMEEYSGKRALRPSERRARIKPLNDLFSMAECCLIADTVQYFKDNEIPFCARNAVTDILEVIRDTHISGDFHRVVSKNLPKYVKPTPHLQEVLQKLKEAGKSLIFVSNSPFWFVDAGMKYVIGDDWRDDWDAVITSAGKPRFYTETNRPFREVSLEEDSERITYDRVTKLEKGKVYTEGCIRELSRLMKWNDNTSNNDSDQEENNFEQQQQRVINNKSFLSGSNVLYVGDSLFADLVDAKREFGWTTAGVTPEVGYEMELQRQSHFVSSQRSITLLLNALRHLQEILGPISRTEEDFEVMDSLERLVSKWRDRETNLMGGNPFGSVFRARHQPSLFAHSLRRYCDLYMSSVSSLRHYSPQHRFYPPENSRLLSHERNTGNSNGNNT